MTEITDRITPEMSEEEVLGVILDEIMARAEPDVAEAIRFCAIPHWFNEEIIAWLRGEGVKPSQRSGEILATLTELTFVGPYHERGWAYHENVRDLLLRRWRERDGEEFQELSGRAAEYFGQKAEAATGEECDEWERERMYHLLVADEERGFELFYSMFGWATKFHRLSTCDHLLKLVEEQWRYLTREHQLWWRFGRGKLKYDSSEWEEALEIFEGLWKEDLPSILESALANDLGSLYHDKGEWERAIEYYERSLAIAEKVDNKHRMATTFNNLGLVYRDKGECERAIEYYERSLAIAEKVGDEHGLAAALHNLGLVHQDRRGWKQAIEYYGRSLAINEKLGDEYHKGMVLWNRAATYYQMDIAEKALVDIEQAVAIFKKFSSLHLEPARGLLEKIRAKARGG